MDCQRIDAILDEHGTGTLSAAQRTEIDAHIESCQRCADARSSHELLAADRPAAPRPELYRELSAKVFDRMPVPAHPPGRRIAARFGIAASAIAIAGLVGLLVYGGGSIEADADGAALADSGPAEPGELNRFGLAAPAEMIGEFMAGRDYERVRNPSSLLSNGTQIQVCEFFMFKCIFCFDFEASLTAWEGTLADDVSLERVPALFNPLARLHARAFYAAELLGAAEGLHTRFYEEIHLFDNPLETLDQIADFFGRNGVSAEDFDEAFASRTVEASMRRAEELNALYGVTATPSLGINGRYLTNPGLAGSNERMLAVVDAIISDEARGRCNADGRSSCPFE
jgi:thiol:disulfide interchange protein DsbA